MVLWDDDDPLVTDAIPLRVLVFDAFEFSVSLFSAAFARFLELCVALVCGLSGSVNNDDRDPVTEDSVRRVVISLILELFLGAVGLIREGVDPGVDCLGVMFDVVFLVSRFAEAIVPRVDRLTELSSLEGSAVLAAEEDDGPGTFGDGVSDFKLEAGLSRYRPFDFR